MTALKSEGSISPGMELTIISPEFCPRNSARPVGTPARETHIRAHDRAESGLDQHSCDLGLPGSRKVELAEGDLG